MLDSHPMLFRNNRPVRIEFVLAGHPTAIGSKVIGYDEIPAKRLPIDFDYPTFVEIDGRKYSVKATDPNTRKQARKAGLLKVWVEEVTLPESAEMREAAQEEATPEAPATPSISVNTSFKTASCAAQAPRLSGKRGEYHYVELMPWQWRQLEFIRRELAPEIGEEFMGIQAVIDESAVEIEGNTRYNEQHVRELTQLGFRGLEESDIALQGKFFTFASRRDGVAIMGLDGYVDNGFGYVLGSGISVYGQEFDGKLRCMGLSLGQLSQRAQLDADIAALTSMMAEHELVLVDWDSLSAVEANPEELRAYLEAWMA